jgi:hypothetical protein
MLQIGFRQNKKSLFSVGSPWAYSKACFHGQPLSLDFNLANSDLNNTMSITYTSSVTTSLKTIESKNSSVISISKIVFRSDEEVKQSRVSAYEYLVP